MADIAEIFKTMPSRLKSDKASGVDMKINFDLTGENAQEWHAAIHDGDMNVDKGLQEGADATIRMDAEDFAKMSRGELNAMMAFMSGKIKVEGDLNSVMKFQNLVGL